MIKLLIAKLQKKMNEEQTRATKSAFNGVAKVP